MVEFDLNESIFLSEDEPPPDCRCCGGDDWAAPHCCVGGLKENPGVWGSGHGSVSVTEVCKACGAYRCVDFGASGWLDGRKVTRVDFREADEASEAFVAELEDQS